MSMQNLKIGQKLLKLQHGNEALTDRWTDGWPTDGRIDTQSLEGITWSYIYISMHMQNFIEICQFILKILSKTAFWTWIKGHNYVVSDWNDPTCNSIPFLSDTNVYTMHTQNFIEISLLIHKILTKNAFWTSIKGHNSVVSEWNYPTCNSIPLLSNTNAYAKFEENRKKHTKVRAWKRSAKHFWHTWRAITLLFQNEISPLAIPYHSSPIPMSMQSLKKIGQKVLS